jgi:putative addiction module component (TIGR02574 family)
MQRYLASNSMSTLPSQIRDLSLDEKIDLLDALWLDIEAHMPRLSDELEAELDERMAEYERDPSSAVPWEQVKAEVFKR